MPKQECTDKLIPAPLVANEFGISRVTLWRWERDGILPRAHRINNQKYYPRAVLESLKTCAARPGGVRRKRAEHETLIHDPFPTR